MIDDLRKAVDVVRAANRILCISHINPDIDTLGSSLAMHLAMTKMGKDSTILNVSSVPPTMKFLPGVENVVSRIHPRRKFDVTIALDSGNTDRFQGPLMEKEKLGRLGTIIKIDHHKLGEDFADIDLTDTQRASTGELVYEFLKHYPVEMDLDIATNIYSAIVSDTGFFCYSNSNASAMRDASEMMQYGVKPWEIASHINENKTVNDINILADTLGTLKISECGRFATLIVTKELKEKHQAENYMLEGFVNYPRSINGIEVSAMLREDSEDRWKVSLRSKGSIDVAKLSVKMGGGGHANAAGYQMEGSCKKVAGRLERMVMTRLAKLDKGK